VKVQGNVFLSRSPLQCIGDGWHLGDRSMKQIAREQRPEWRKERLAGIARPRAPLTIGGIPVYAAGEPQPLDGPGLQKALAGPEVVLGADLGTGDFQATAWGCDLTEEYVRINSEYTT